MLLDSVFKSDSRVEREIELLLNIGYNIEIACLKDDNLPSKESRNGYVIKRKIDPILLRPLNKLYAGSKRKLISNLNLKDTNIIYCHDYHMINIGATIKKNNPHLYLIYDSHEYLKGWPLYKDSKSIKLKFKNYLVWKKLIRNERKSIKFTDTIITVTKSISHQLSKDHDLNDRPIFLHNIPKKKKLNSSQNYFHKKFNIPNDHIIVIHLGSIYHTDNQLKKLFKVFIKNQSVKLIFIGNRPKHYELKKTIKNNLILNNKIFFHDFPSTSEITNLISSADIGLCHIRTEFFAHKITFTNKFFEYSMAEIPVISTKQDICVEYAKLYDNAIFYDENSYKSLNNAFEKIIKNISYYKKNAKQLKINLDWKKEAQYFIIFFEKLKRNGNK